MLNFRYRIKAFNDKGERINRNKCVFPPESERTFTVGDRAFKEIKACKNLKIKKVVYICPICNREFDKRNGLTTHIYKTHPEAKYKMKGKKWWIQN